MGSLLTGAVAGLESRLDSILDADNQAVKQKEEAEKKKAAEAAARQEAEKKKLQVEGGYMCCEG